MDQTRDAHIDGWRGTAELLLWQGVPEQAPVHESVVIWEGSAPRETALSLTQYVDAHGEDVRREYLAWAHDLGLAEVAGRRLCERFTAKGAGSLWALSQFVEQSTWNQPSLEKIVKLLGFERLMTELAPKLVRFSGWDHDLSRVLEVLCRQRFIEYRWDRRQPPPATGRRRVRRALPHTVRGLAMLGYLTMNRLRLRKPRQNASANVRRVLFCAPFFNHNVRLHEARNFTSRYWTVLPHLLVQSGWDVHWLHLFYRHDKIPNARSAAVVLRQVNRESPESGTHSFVESYLPVRAFFRIFFSWCRLAAESVRVGMRLRSRFDSNPRESFWPLLRHDWANAFRGAECVTNLVYAQSFDGALRSLPRQDEGVYLMENQGWERALARAWNAHGHGRLSGVAHSTIRFWDLRYHCDPRRYEPYGRRLLSGPGTVIFNGQVARRSYLATSGVREKLADCEALRYLHLVRGTPCELDRDMPLRLLVLGDFLPNSTDGLLRLVSGACATLSIPIQTWVKPHPNCPVDPKAYPKLNLRVSNDPIPQLVSSAHLVMASNTTSAAVDAYIGGGRILVYDNQRGMNLSPLRALPGVTFVHNAANLAMAIERLWSGSGGELITRTQDFYYIDAQLPRWREHFGLDPAADRQPAEINSNASST
jgi:surface carbohydrate biosynthesis protein (TIGR04326 family)